jgi:predicted chitinase
MALERKHLWWIGGAVFLAVAVWKRKKIVSSAQTLVGRILTIESIRKAMPNVSLTRLTTLLPDLIAALDEAQINTPRRISAFIAQLGHESGDFRYFEEIASGDAYEGRDDLGNTQPGDGRRYKGRGPIQLTGRANYRAFTKAIGSKYGVDFEANPELVAQPKWGFKAAAWYWNSRKLNQYADRGDFDAITYRINGGYNGKADRDARYAVATSALSSNVA